MQRRISILRLNCQFNSQVTDEKGKKTVEHVNGSNNINSLLAYSFLKTCILDMATVIYKINNK